MPVDNFVITNVEKIIEKPAVIHTQYVEVPGKEVINIIKEIIIEVEKIVEKDVF